MLTTNRLFLAGTTLALAAVLSHCDDGTPAKPADLTTGAADMTAGPDMTTIAAPVITMISPGTAVNTGGGMLTITGTGFRAGATVTVGGTACANPNVTPTQITCTIPAKAMNCAAATVVVTNPDTQSVTNSTGFSYRTATLTYAAATPPTVATATSPRRVLAADVDGDGKTDLVTTNQAANSVSVLIGNGDGTFKAKVDYTTGTAPAEVVMADVTADGKADLVTVNATGISVLAGNGNGTFGAANTVAITGLVGGVSIASSDFNGDMKADLVVAGTNATALVLNNPGTGVFTAAPSASLTTAGTPGEVRIGDLDSDGKQDIVVTNQTTNNVSVFKGMGASAFAAKVDYATANRPLGLRLADVSGDGKLDVVTANGTSNNVSILTGTGAATAPFLNAKADFGTANGPETVIVADLNNDGIQDVATASPGATNMWSFLVGMGNTMYAATVNTAAGTTAANLAAGDFNGDKLSDVAVSNMGAATVSVFLQQCK